jgi:phage-related protein
MERIREIIAYKNYFEDFLKEQPAKVQDKIFKILEAIETLERVFCFFDEGKLVILLNGFQKKTQKTPKKEIDKALQLMAEYYEGKR